MAMRRMTYSGTMVQLDIMGTQSIGKDGYQVDGITFLVRIPTKPLLDQFTVLVASLILWSVVGCGRPDNPGSVVQPARIPADATVVFQSWNGRAEFALTQAQAGHLVEILNRPGGRFDDRERIALDPYGMFDVAGRTYEWYYDCVCLRVDAHTYLRWDDSVLKRMNAEINRKPNVLDAAAYQRIMGELDK